MTVDYSLVDKSPVTWLGRFAYYFLPYRKKVISQNINRVFGGALNDLQKKHLICAYYSHLILSIKEMIQIRFMSQEQLRSQVDVIGHEHLLKIAEANKGVLILTGHLGNWEFAPLGGILNFKQFQGHFHFIRRTLGNKWIEKCLFSRYFQAGLHVIPKKNSLHQVLAALEKNHAVVFVMDQHASLANRDGIAVEFFGTKAGTYRSLASIAQNTGIPVIPAAGYRLKNGRHVLEFHKPIFWEEQPTSQQSIYHNTLRYNQALERMILAHPEQWMWLHRRWKLKLTS